MLRTSLADLKELHRKEELEMRFSLKLEKQTVITMPKIKNDHLPYGNLINKIASTLENSPPKPIFKLRMEKEYTIFNSFFLYLI